MKNFRDFNEQIAILGTRLFSSIWTFYIFAAWGALSLIPGLPTGFQQVVLLVSSAFIQLAALPLLAVGASVMSRSSERRSKEDHAMLRREFAAQNEELARLEHIHRDVMEIRASVRRIEAGTKKEPPEGGPDPLDK
jgi:hypothetical protein